MNKYYLLILFSINIYFPFSCFTSLQAQTDISSQIDTSQEVIKDNLFVTSRNIGKYIDAFGPDFSEHIKHLKMGEHVIDMGSGEGYFLTNLMELGTLTYSTGIDKFRELHTCILPTISLTGITYEMKSNDSPILHDPSCPLMVRFFTGRFFEDIPDIEIMHERPLAQLITDFYGILSYSYRPDMAWQRYLDFTKVRGKIFIHSTLEPDDEIMEQSFVNTATGPVRLIPWLLTHTQGITVGTFHGEYHSRDCTYIVEKKDGPAKLKKSLVLKNAKYGAPTILEFDEAK